MCVRFSKRWEFGQQKILTLCWCKTCMCACQCRRVRMCACLRAAHAVYVSQRTRVQKHQVCLRTHAHACARASERAFACLRVCVFVRLCVCAFVLVRACICVCACVRALRAYVYTRVLRCIYDSMRVHASTEGEDVSPHSTIPTPKEGGAMRKGFRALLI